MTDYKDTFESGRYEMKFGKVSARLKRGKETNDFFTIVYGIFLALLVASIGELPESSTPWFVKILLNILAAIFLIYIFRLNRVRNFLVRIRNYILDYEERY